MTNEFVPLVIVSKLVSFWQKFSWTWYGVWVCI